MAPTYNTPIEVYANGILFECGCKIVNCKESPNPRCSETKRHPSYKGWLIDTAQKTYDRCNTGRLIHTPTAILY
jgi:hypothetical protein